MSIQFHPTHRRGQEKKPQDGGLQQGKNRSRKPSFSHHEMWGLQARAGACLHGDSSSVPGDGDRYDVHPKDTEDTRLWSQQVCLTEKGQRAHGRKPKDHDTKLKVIENPKVAGETKVTTQEEIPRAHSTKGKVTGVNAKVTSFRKNA